MRNRILFIITVIFFTWSCTTNQKTKEVLKVAGPNRAELEKILTQYSEDESYSIHLEAARYLINNMPGHYAYDTTGLSTYRPVVEKIYELRNSGVSVNNIKEQVNPLMDDLNLKYPLYQFYSNTQNDLNYITAEGLKNHIDLAVKSYDNNPFKDSIAFEDFLEYVAPYRILDGKSVEDWRSYFIQNHAEYLDQDYNTLHQLCDSLLYNYYKIEIGWDIATRFPYVKFEDYLKSRMALCPQKTWFNCMLLRSFGIPATIDYNPVSRLHEVGHEWNAIKLKSGTHPFEAFWGGGNIWHLKKLYGRESMHDMLGIVEFPKIYRKTYKMNVTELLEHTIKTEEEIPTFFQNPFQLDVSEEYFKTYPVETPVLKEIEDHNYVYACVMGANQAWVPVEFGKIKRGKTLFRNMGSNNVYLPCNYEFGSIEPASYPVFLNDEGKSIILEPDTIKRISLHAAHVAYPEPWIAVLQKCLVGARVEVSNDKDFKTCRVLYEIKEPYDLYPNYVSLPDDASKYRYIRFTIPDVNLGRLHEIKFFNNSSGIEEEIRGKLISSFPDDIPLLQKIVDKVVVTYVDFFSLSAKHKEMDEVWFGYDFKEPVAVDAFEYYLRGDAYLRPGTTYELLYWDFGWKSMGKKKFNGEPLWFDNVPENALYLIKIIETNRYSRIFTYINGEQKFM